ncbi:MAG TPA: hypothetical protein VE975_02400 [Actinomycetota bacterium]|nr:hypothetical protein [Actinomycetota bacterium]
MGAKALIASTLRAAGRAPDISGTAAVRVDLGIPALGPGAAQAGVSSPLAALAAIAGDHRVKLWASADGLRVAELLPEAERALFASEKSVWLWDSRSYTAYRLPAPHHRHPPASLLRALDPRRAATCLLKAIPPGTTVSVQRNETVAGRRVYALTLKPKTNRTLVGRIEIYIDSQTRIPLGTAVYGRGDKEASVSAEFTSVSFGRIPSSTFAFSPPAGATIKTLHGPSRDRPEDEQRSHPRPQGSGFRLAGHGWTTVAAVRVPAEAAARLRSSAAGRLLPFTGPLFSARLVAKGAHVWLLAGAVPQSALKPDAARLP